MVSSSELTIATANQPVVGLTVLDTARLLSQHAPGNKGVMVLQYPSEDEGNRRSRTKLVADLNSHGFTTIAQLVENGVEIIMFADVEKAKRALVEINKDTLAIGATLYINGLPVDHE